MFSTRNCRDGNPKSEASHIIRDLNKTGLWTVFDPESGCSLTHRGHWGCSPLFERAVGHEPRDGASPWSSVSSVGRVGSTPRAGENPFKAFFF